MKLTNIDLIFMGIYFLLLIIIGIIVNRKQSNEDFLISNRNLSIYSGIATINASKTGAIIMAYTALVFLYDLSAIWYFFGTLLGYIFFLPFAIKLFKQSKKKQYTLAEYFYKNYGKINGNITNILTIIIMLGFLIINLIAASSVFNFFTQISFSISASIIIISILIYMILGGFKAVVKTDLVQYIAILFILIIIIPIALFNSQNISQSQIINTINFDLFQAGISTIIGFLLLGFLFPFASPELWQRIYAFADTKTLKKSIIYSSLIYFLFGSMLTYLALIIKTKLPHIDPNIAFISGLTQMLPIGLTGLSLILLISAFMSSIDTYIFTASSALILNFTNNKDKNTIKKRIKITMTIISFIALILTIIISDLVDSIYLTAFVVVLAIPTIVTYFNPNINKNILKGGFFLGLISVLIMLPFEFSKDIISPNIILKGIGTTIIGMIIVWIIIKIQKLSK